MLNNRVWGVKVSDYGLEHGYMDYSTLSKLVEDHILNNNIMEAFVEDWVLVSGDYDKEIYQYYIISDSGAYMLQKYTDEVVFYNDRLDLYVWGITHFGTGWDYVLTDVKLIGDGL